MRARWRERAAAGLAADVSGVSRPVAQALNAARARRRGGRCWPCRRGRSATFPPQTLRPGSAVAVGYSNGDVRTSSVGTVAYVDGDRVWIFGHALEGDGRRALLLQDAYVFRIINNPLSLGALGATYKLARLRSRPRHGHSATASAPSPAARAAAAHGARQGDRPRRGQQGDQRSVVANAADEAAVDLPERRVVDVVRGAAGGLAGRRRGARQHALAAHRRDVRADHASPSSRSRCASATATSPTAAGQAEDGSVANAVLCGVANDLGGALATIDAYTGKPPTRDRRQRPAARSTAAPTRRSSARHAPGARPSGPARPRPGVAPARPRRPPDAHLHDAHPRLAAQRQPARCGSSAQDADQGEDGFTTIILGEEEEENEGGDPGPATLDELAESVRATQR